jgi:hypothetical protein
MTTGIFLEYLGEISTDLIFQHLTDANQLKPSIEDFRLAFPRGFVAAVQIEQRIYEMPEEKKTALEITQGRMQRAWGIEPPGRKLVGLVLTPKNE